MRKAYALLPAIMGMLLTIAACSQPVPPAPERGFSVDALLIDERDFPARWSDQGPAGPTPSVDGAIFASESIQQRFTADAADLFSALHEVYRFRSSYRAKKEYQKQLPILYNSRSIAVLTPWEPPTELPYQSSVADESHFACSRSGITGFWDCMFMGQYEEYLVVFSTRVGDHMGYADLERLLRAIDERMRTYLAENAP
jgi:hypothetical protein